MSDLEAIKAVLDDYPQEVKLGDGQRVELQPARKGNRSAIVKFAKGLSEQDLLFLRVDITQPDVVEHWLDNITNGDTVSILAWMDKTVVGYCTVDRNPAQWTRRVGEIRVNVSEDYRTLGLGRHLVGKIFDVARGIGLRKLVAHMTPDQVGAQAAFARLGFRPEALLADWVEDREGNVRDLAILSYDIEGFNGQIDTPLKL